MPRTQTDFIDRSIETMFARGLGNAATLEPRPTLPQINLSDDQSKLFQEITDGDRASNQKHTSHVIETPDGPVWLSGNAVMCGCPDCEAPVSVRLWLMVADCWNCESAIELSYEQQLAAEHLAQRIAPRPFQAVSVPRRCAQRAADADEESVQSLEDLRTDESPRRLVDIIHSFTNALPAWLISLLVHLVLLLILALILLPDSNELPTITISTAVNKADETGGTDFEIPPEIPLEFDSNTPENELIERELRKVAIAAEQDARELLVDPDPLIELPTIDDVKQSVTTNPQSFTLAIRDPRLRNEIVKREGGTTLSEAAVSRGLRWLASVQNPDGSWSLAHYHRSNRENNKGDAAATSLALLPFLGAGQTHEYGVYKETVAKGLKWLIEHQKSDGELMHGIDTNAAIYAHGQASIVLVEALAMTGDEQFREPAQKAIDYIEAFQHKHGGWRYRKREAGDTSVMGWQLMALQSARLSNTGLQVRDSTLMLADQYLDLASRGYTAREYRDAPDGTLYRYQPTDREPKAAMTAEGVLCRMYLGWKRNDGRMVYAMDWLLENALPDVRDRKHNLYYYYYATQIMHHYGGQRWEKWNKHVRDLLIIKQERGGKHAGSWDSRDYKYGSSGGRIYATSLAICTLEVYYRHLPLFKKLNLE